MALNLAPHERKVLARALLLAAVFARASAQAANSAESFVDLDALHSVSGKHAGNLRQLDTTVIDLRPAIPANMLEALETPDRRLEESSTENNTAEGESGASTEGESTEGEGGEGEGGEEEGGEEEEEVDETSLATAGVLIGSVAFIVTIFYLVNNKDANIRQATWNLISDTVSIFCAVLWYQGMDAVFDEWFKEEDDATIRIIIGMLHWLFWYTLVQGIAITVCISDRIGPLGFKSTCTLGAHLSGFAAKECFNTIMQSKNFRDSVGMSIVALIISILMLLAVLAIAYSVRNFLIYPRIKNEKKVDVCGEEIREVENDMVALSVGFLISQVLRFALHGKLPSEELDEADNHEQWEAWLLFTFAFVAAGLAVVAVKIQFLELGMNKYLERIVDNIKMIMVLTMSWCLLFWGQWEMFDTHFAKKQRKVFGRIFLAVLLTVFAILNVIVLDAIADRQNSKFGKTATRLLMFGFGFTLAFSWEQTFDLCVEEIAKGEKSISEASAKMLLAVLLVGIVAPAWGMYILPKTMSIEEVLEEEEKEERDEEKAGLEEARAPGPKPEAGEPKPPGGAVAPEEPGREPAPMIGAPTPEVVGKQ